MKRKVNSKSKTQNLKKCVPCKRKIYIDFNTTVNFQYFSLFSTISVLLRLLISKYQNEKCPSSLFPSFRTVNESDQLLHFRQQDPQKPLELPFSHI